MGRRKTGRRGLIMISSIRDQKKNDIPAYNEGYYARQRFDATREISSRTQNPYPETDPVNYYWWRVGWDDADKLGKAES